MYQNIGLFGGASDVVDKKYTDAVYKLCNTLAKKGHDLVYGAGGVGCMGAAARGFLDAGRHVYGFTPKFMINLEPVLEGGEITLVDNMADRKEMMEQKADAFIIVPGGIGTMDEFYEIITLKKLGVLNKPIIVFNIDNYYKEMLEANDFFVKEKFAADDMSYLYSVCDSISDVLVELNV